MKISITYFFCLFLTSSLLPNKNDSLLNAIIHNTDPLKKTNAILSLSRAYNLAGKHDSAIKFAEYAKSISVHFTNKKSLATAYDYIGHAFMLKGNYEKALMYYLKCLELRESKKNDYEIKTSYLNLGNIYYSLNDLERSLLNYQKFLELSKKFNDKQAIAYAYNNIGNIYAEQNQSDKAIENLTASLKIKTEIGNIASTANAYHNIGNIYEEKGDLTTALDYYRTYLKISEASGNNTGIANGNQSIGKTLLKQGDINGAQIYLQKARAISENLDNKVILKDVYLGMSELFIKKQNYKKALEYFQLSKQITDSLFNTEMSKNMAEMVEKYESEKKDKEIQLLNRDKAAKVIEAEAERKNSLYVIISSAMFILLIIFVSVFTLRYLRQKQKQKLDEIGKEKIMAEINLLKSQLNPHVIFNTLNTIYLQISDENESAKQMTLKFADLLRYQLYDCNSDFIPFEKEVDYLRKFIEMQELRMSKRCRINFTVDDSVGGFMVPPLLFNPLMENAFKYVTNDKEKDNFVLASLVRKEDTIVFDIKNTYYESTVINPSHNGIGLENLKSRLKLIYPGKHELLIHKTSSVFHVNLTLHA